MSVTSTTLYVAEATTVLDNVSTINLNVTSENSFQKESFAIWAKYLCVGIAGALSLLGGFGNAITIAAYRRSRKLQTSFNHLITNLCVIDLCFSILILPAIIPLIISEYQIYSYRTCRMVGYFYHVLTSASVVNLVFIAVNRYVGIVHSSKYRHVFAASDLRWWLLSTWLSAPIFYLPFILDSAFAWTSSNSVCQLNNHVPVMVLKIYKVVVCNLLQLIPTIVLVLLYRAIFAKVKECRKLVEHYPKPGSCSPSFIDPDLDESRLSRGRFHSFRRHSVSKSRRTDSYVTPRPSGSPQHNVGKKYNTMSYLQVPPAALSNAVEIKGDSIVEKQEGIGMTLAFSTQSLDSHSVSVVSSDAVRVAQSTPDLAHESFTEKDTDETTLIKRKSFDEENYTPAFPLLTSERPRRRMQDLRNLHIMSTIDSESNSKSVSCEIQDHVSDHRISPLVSPTTDDGLLTNKLSNNDPIMHQFEKDYDTSNFTNECKPKFTLGEDDSNNNNASCHLTISNIQTCQKTFEIPFIDKASSCADITSFTTEPAISAPAVNLLQADEIQLTAKNAATKPLLRTFSLSCAELPDSHASNTCVITRDTCNEISRRHSISTCSDSKCSYIEKHKKAKMGRRSLKMLSWKKKSAMSAPEQNSTKRSFATRKYKSEGSRRYSKSWKKHWKKKNSPSIKIVIDHATSEETNIENSDSINYFAEMEEELQTCLPKLAEDIDTLKSYREASSVNASPKKLSKQDSGSKIESPNKLSALNIRLKKNHKNISKSVESLPSQLPSRKNSLIQNEITQDANEAENKNIVRSDSKKKHLQSKRDKTSPTENEQSLDVVDTRRLSASDDRRSSITSHAYRYAGAEDCASRNGSMSCLSFADDCRRRSNTHSPVYSKENSDANKKSGKNRKISVYSHWQRRKSFFSSFHSGVSTDSRRHKRRREAEKHIAYSGVVICVAFAISVLPSYAVDIITALTLIKIPSDIQLLLAMLSWLHVVINPTLYGYLNPQYRVVFRQMRRRQKQQCTKCARGCLRGSETKILSRGPSNASSNKQSRSRSKS